MNGGDILSLITVFVLSAFVGFEVIAKVPSTLHTPLMSGTNAIHGVVLVGAMTRPRDGARRHAAHAGLHRRRARPP